MTDHFPNIRDASEIIYRILHLFSFLQRLPHTGNQSVMFLRPFLFIIKHPAHSENDSVRKYLQAPFFRLQLLLSVKPLRRQNLILPAGARRIIAEINLIGAEKYHPAS